MILPSVSIPALNTISASGFYTLGLFPSLSLLQPPALQTPTLHGTHHEAARLPLQELPGERTSGQHPSIQWAAHILHFVALTGGFELVYGVKRTADNSLKLKIGNRKEESLLRLSENWVGGEECYLDSFRCPAYQHVRGSVVMKLKFLKQGQQLE